MTRLEASYRRSAGRSAPGRRDQADRLVAALKAGGDREEIFRELSGLCRRPIHAFFRRNGFSDGDRRDLAQETLLRVCRKIDAFRGDSRFETWLYEIASNVRKQEIRRRRAIKRDAQEVSLEGLPIEPRGAGPFPGRSTVPSPEHELLDKERRELVRAEVEKMPPRMRRCYQLWAEGFKLREIEVLMGISLDAVKSHLGAAKARLKDRLGNRNNTESRPYGT